jgi:mono/diheme cytochrome c family protein
VNIVGFGLQASGFGPDLAWRPEPVAWSRHTARVAAVLVLAAFTAACRQDMHDAPRYEPLEASTFFSNGQSARPLVANTVARGQLREDRHLYEGIVDGRPAETFPFPITEDVMRRGQERFNVFCSPCHSRTGDGNGMIVQRGFRHPPSYHEDRLRNAPVGYFFDVMTHGFGAMEDYSSQLPVADRWAIAAYIRALQLSQRATMDDVPADRRADLDRPAGAPAEERQQPQEAR